MTKNNYQAAITIEKPGVIKAILPDIPIIGEIIRIYENQYRVNSVEMNSDEQLLIGAEEII